MIGVPQAFETFAQRLELTDAEQEAASRQQNALRENLRRQINGVTRDFLSGSYKRRTAIRPLHDIDVIIELDASVHQGPRADNVSRVLQTIQGALQRAYPSSKSPTLQNRSVNIEFAGTGIGFDVVPGFADASRGGVYWIPDRSRCAWIPTSPEAHADYSTRANERAGKKLKPLVKMIKHWRRHQRHDLRSFHLEMMCANALTAPPRSYSEGLRDLFSALSSAVLRACPDPASVGPAIDDGTSNSDRQRLSWLLSQAASEASRLTQLEARGFDTHAIEGWSNLLGSAFSAAAR